MVRGGLGGPRRSEFVCERERALMYRTANESRMLRDDNDKHTHTPSRRTRFSHYNIATKHGEFIYL